MKDKYLIQIVSGEHFIDFAETDSLNYRDLIAGWLLDSGKAVRVTAISQDFSHGSIQHPTKQS